MRQGLDHAIIRGMLIGGMTAGMIGGLWIAVNCYLGRLDPDIYPNRALFTLSFMFLLGFIFAAVPGIVLGVVGSLIVFFIPGRKQSLSASNDVPTQNTWPPAPVMNKIEENDKDA